MAIDMHLLPCRSPEGERAPTGKNASSTLKLFVLKPCRLLKSDVSQTALKPVTGSSSKMCCCGTSCLNSKWASCLKHTQKSKMFAFLLGCAELAASLIQEACPSWPLMPPPLPLPPKDVCFLDVSCSQVRLDSETRALP